MRDTGRPKVVDRSAALYNQRVNILALGDLLLDVVVRYDPLSGEADMGADGVQIWPGGSSANFAVHAARLGANVRFVGRVGRDWAGDMLVRSLEAERVTGEVRICEEETTGRVLVMVSSDGNRRMWSFPGASATLSPADLDAGWFEGLDALHLTGYSLLRDGPRPAALDALRLAREHDVPFATLDPNPGHLISDFGPARFREMTAALRFDALFPNIEEGRLLTGLTTPEEVALDLLDISPLVALKLGAEGCIVAVAGGDAAPNRVVSVPAPAAVPVDATGAGDAFAAGFVVEYLRTHDLRLAARSANRVAADVVGRIGAR